ncbi:M48 family metallopeptidase [Flavobacterium sp. GCM10023249]|uniref:M48 family metallopeptidase n=1 Tax=unclassified Flavobacterium TaxID=196869 RepID=UPI00360BD79F
MILLNSLFCFSQSKEFSYLPANKDSLNNYIKSAAAEKIVKLGDKNRKDIKKIVEERRDNFIKSIEDSTYIFDKKINNYLKGILSEIYQKNNIKDAKKFYFLIDKSPIPNAACYGNGIFSINLGLFNLIDSDDELAFIIAHEIAHYQLDHNDSSLLKYIETMNSKDFKSKVKQIDRQEYGKRKAFYDLITGLNYNFLRRSRKAETQADSLGLALFNKTKYDKKASVSALKKLEKIDEIIFNEDPLIKQHFNFEEYPFKEAWLNKEENLFDLKETADDYAMHKDSLKTHPDIPIRIEQLNALLKSEANGTAAMSDNLREIKSISAKNSILIFIDDSKIDLALYQTMILFNRKEIDQERYTFLIADLLKRTYDSKLKHSFGKYVDPVSPFSEEKHLNEVRTFLHNLEVKNVRKLGHSFCSKNKELMKNNPEFAKIEQFFKNLNI